MNLLKLFKQELLRYRFMLKPFFILTFIYCLALSTIIRANFYYRDDLARTVLGYRDWSPWSRYISEYLSIVIHTDRLLMDISPLTQLLGAVMIALASVILIYVFTEREKYTVWNMLAVLPLGIAPYFLQCWSYKFDAPYMALSVLASIFPFLFVRYGNKYYFITSVIGCLIMCMTYQASSGIYVIVTLFLAAKKFNEGEPCLKFIATSALSYIGSLEFFRLLLMHERNVYATTDIAPLHDLLKVVGNNIQIYFQLIHSDFHKVWQFLIVLLAIAFVCSFIANSSLKKYQACIMSLLVLVLGGILSFGGFILLEKPLFGPRGMYGIGVFLTLLSINVTILSKYVFVKLISVLLSWCFFTFSFAYGNALAEQLRYTDFRINLLVNDLNHLQPLNKETMLMQLEGNIGRSPVITRNFQKRYPVIRKLVPTTFAGGSNSLDSYYLFNYFDLPKIKRFVPTKKENFKNYNLPVVINSRTHIIKADSKRILVELK